MHFASEIWMERGEVTSSTASDMHDTWSKGDTESRRHEHGSTALLPKRTSSLSASTSLPEEGVSKTQKESPTLRVHVISDASLGYPSLEGKGGACSLCTPVIEDSPLSTPSLGLVAEVDSPKRNPYGEAIGEDCFSLSSDTLVGGMVEWERGGDEEDWESSQGDNAPADTAPTGSMGQGRVPHMRYPEHPTSPGTSLSDLTSSQMLQYWMPMEDEEEEDDEDEEFPGIASLPSHSNQSSKSIMSPGQKMRQLSLQESYYTFQNERITIELANATTSLHALTQIYQEHEKRCLNLQYEMIPRAWERIRELENVLSNASKTIRGLTRSSDSRSA
ncbi:MAG: hypothetical protein DHS80DRAFT_28448 [Piptocephalis tieghemiana]|nr:MAG: hypothetical protein DHS80DRAFT_28448 [Piptocephalis tieghemiana]